MYACAVCVYACMDTYMDVWMHVWMNEWMYGRTDECNVMKYNVIQSIVMECNAMQCCAIS